MNDPNYLEVLQQPPVLGQNTRHQEVKSSSMCMSWVNHLLITTWHSGKIEGRNTMTVRGSRTQPFLMMAIQVTHKRNAARASAACTAAIAVSKQSYILCNFHGLHGNYITTISLCNSHGFQSRHQYSRCMTRDFKSVSMRERPRDQNTLSIHPILSLAFLTIFIIWKAKVAVILIIMPRSLTCSLSSIFESSNDLYVGCCRFYFSRSSNLLALNFILFVSAHLYSLCNSFCSICVSTSSFIPRRIRDWWHNWAHNKN